MATLEALKQMFTEVLSGVRKDNVIPLIAKLDETGFFTAPASTAFHGNYAGGLVEHSLNVYQQAMYLKKIEIHIKPQIADKLPDDSIKVAALLHDVCKADIYKIEKKWRKDKDNKWEQQYAYVKDFTEFPLGHGEKSVIRLLKWGFPLTEDEMFAIRYHMGAWDLADYQDSRKCFDAACDKSPLASIIISADWLASRITEQF